MRSMRSRRFFSPNVFSTWFLSFAVLRYADGVLPGQGSPDQTDGSEGEEEAAKAAALADGQK